jgi:hypothetical protein
MRHRVMRHRVMRHRVMRHRVMRHRVMRYTGLCGMLAQGYAESGFAVIVRLQCPFFGFPSH